jgi:hypothetical protein
MCASTLLSSCPVYARFNGTKSVQILVSRNVCLEILSKTFQSVNVDVEWSEFPCFAKGKSKMKCNGLLHTKQSAFYQNSLWIDVIFLKRESRKRLYCKNGLSQWLSAFRDSRNDNTAVRFRGSSRISVSPHAVQIQHVPNKMQCKLQEYSRTARSRLTYFPRNGS